MMYLFTDKNANPDQESKHMLDFGSLETIDSIFLTYINKICEKVRKEDFIKVRGNCVQNVNVTGGISLSEDTLDKINSTENFDELFKILYHTPYWNWMNIKLIIKVVGDCLPAQKLLEQYKNKVFSRKLKDVLTDIPDVEVPEDKYTEVKEKWQKNFDDLTIKDVVKHWHELEKTFKVEAMLLKNITKGCVEICWLLPNNLVKHAIFSATGNQSTKFGYHLSNQDLFPEMLYLKIGDVIIKKDIIGSYVCNCKVTR